MVKKRLRLYAESGGKGSLVQYADGDRVHGGCEGLSQAEFDAYQRARLMADPRNDGDWDKAIEVLKSAGFRVYWD